MVFGKLRTGLSILLCIFLFGCAAGATATTPPETLTPLPGEEETESALIATATASAEPPFSSYAGEVLNSAAANLLHAASFELSTYEVRAYQVIEAGGEARPIYGEFTTHYEVIRLPALKVHGSHQYRYDPQADFQSFDSYAYQEGGKYFNRPDETQGAGDALEIDPEQIEPLAGDIYQTLITYADQAKFVTESDGIAVYTIEHPKWYTLKGAIGFAGLGFLHMQENGDQLIEQYVADSYPNVKPILFTVYVAVDQQLITKVEVDDQEFMLSIWAEVDRALIEHGAKPEDLARYQVMEINGAEYHFSNYNQVEDFEIP